MAIPRLVLQLWGKRDEVLSVDLALSLPRDYTPHQRSRVQLIDAKHFVQAEKKKGVNEALLKFIKEE
jgi:pimeloyl-ACP methyl ester carboxylesterase